MCIRDRSRVIHAYTIDMQIAVFATIVPFVFGTIIGALVGYCLLYTSDAADERSSVDLGGRRIIKKKKIQNQLQQKIGVQIIRITQENSQTQ